MKLLENKIFIKGISVLALAAMLTGFLPSAALAEEGEQTQPSENPCSHEYTSVVTTEPTCAAGVRTYTCSKCGNTYPEAITAVSEHSFSAYAPDNNATCTENGTQSRVCDVCGTIDSIPLENSALGHSLQDMPARAATCSQPGFKAPCKYCPRCGKCFTLNDQGQLIEMKDNVIPMLPHSWNEGEITTAASCLATGVMTYTCTVCNQTYTEETPFGDHSWDEGTVTTEPTCTATGVKTYTCSICSATKTEEIPALGHTWNDGEVTKEPTCLATGVKTYTCTVCNETYTEEIPIGEHSWDEGTITTEPTCTEKGEKTYTCSVCSATKPEEIPALGHTWNNGEVTKEASCKAVGEKTYTCSVCTATKTEGIPTVDHSWDEGKVTTEATCMEKGVKTYTCSKCGDTYTEAIAADAEHTWNDGEVTKEASCTEKGEKTYTCSVCKATKTEGIPALGHSMEYDKEEELYYCKNCKTYYQDEAGTKTLAAANEGAIYLGTEAEALTGSVTITEDADKEILTATVTDGNNTGTLSYQWYCDGSLVSGATASAYTLKTEDNAKKFSCEVSSSVQTGTIKSKDYTAITAPAAPTNLGTTPELNDGANGIITNVSTLMEYSAAIAGPYTACTGTTVTGLPAGTYYVRVKAADPRPAGKTTMVEVKSTYSITPSIAYGYGSISPSSKVILNKGDSQTFTFTPNANYYIYGVYVDGVYVGYASSYTFTNVTSMHTISVKFYYGNNPKTGDNAALALWAAGAVLSLVGATALTMTCKKKKNKS